MLTTYGHLQFPLGLIVDKLAIISSFLNVFLKQQLVLLKWTNFKISLRPEIERDNANKTIALYSAGKKY
jgi:hypothetical protein